MLFSLLMLTIISFALGFGMGSMHGYWDGVRINEKNKKEIEKFKI